MRDKKLFFLVFVNFKLYFSTHSRNLFFHHTNISFENLEKVKTKKVKKEKYSGPTWRKLSKNKLIINCISCGQLINCFEGYSK